MGKESEHFFKEDIQMAVKHMKRCSASSVIMEMHIITTVRYYTPTRMARIKKSDANKC